MSVTRFIERILLHTVLKFNIISDFLSNKRTVKVLHIIIFLGSILTANYIIAKMFCIANTSGYLSYYCSS